jgi:hypothetical protein
MGIPYGMDYTATVTGSTAKLVSCEQCQVEYVYKLQRTATGSGSSLLFVDNEGARNRASSRAGAKLDQVLDRAVDLVPCPACGWYQKNMVAKARRLHRQWLVYLGIGLMVGLIPLGFIILLIVNSANHRQIDDPVVPVPIMAAIAGFIVLVAFGLMIARARLARSYDPNNDDVEARKRLGKERAVLRADLERAAREAQNRANQSNPPGDVPPG